jgi:integrase
MARQEGEVVERHWKRGRGYALRFRAYGERRYVSLGFERDGWDRRRAEEELQNIMADVRRGLWVPPRRGSARDRDGGWEEREVPTLGRFAADLVASHEGQISEATTRQRRWALAHVAPLLGDLRLDEIDVRCIDEFRDLKIKESEARARAIGRGRPYRTDRGRIMKPLSPASINKTINFLQWVLGIALEYKYVTENAAAGRRRRLPVRPSAPVHLDTATHIEALLEGAAAVDRAPLFEPCGREAIVATLIFAGPRAHELCNLSWRDVDLAGGRIFVGRSKTAAGLREIPMQPVLRDVLAAHKAAATSARPDDPVFTNGVGRRIDRDNLRNRVVKPAVARADELLEARGLVPIPKGLTTHKLRHTFASVLVACGEDPISLMRQIGHTNPNFTLRVYAHLMSRDASERERLKALVRGERVIGHEAPAPRPVDLSEYEGPILEALAERGGRSTRAEVLAFVGEAMSDRHGTADFELLPSGTARWEARVGKVRQGLMRRGLMDNRAGRGEWRLTELGLDQLHRPSMTTKSRRLNGRKAVVFEVVTTG